jgi:hypothetical protein
VLKVPVYGTFVRSFSVADSVVSRIVWSSPICLYKGNLCRENDIIEVNYVHKASVSLFGFCYGKSERQFVYMHIMQAFGVMGVHLR